MRTKRSTIKSKNKNSKRKSKLLSAALALALFAGTVPFSPYASAAGLEVELNWTDPADSDFDHVNVYRDGSLIGSSTTGKYIDTTANYSTTYTYTLKTVDTTGNESTGVDQIITTPADNVAPGDVTLPTSTETGTSVTVSWTASSDSDLDHYNVYKDGTLVTSIPKGTDTYTFTGLDEGTTYEFKITAVDTTGNESTGVTVTKTTPDTTAPAEVTSVTNVASGSTVDLSWTASSSSDLNHYNVYQDGVLIDTVPAGTNTYQFSGLDEKTSYSLKVTSVDNSGNESTGVVASVETLDVTAPSNLTGGSTTSTEDSIEYTWTDPVDFDLDHFNVYLNGSLIDTVGKGIEAYTYSGLSENTNYTIKITSVDLDGNESIGADIVVSTLDVTAPVDTTSITNSSTDTTVDLSWVASPDSDLAYYNIYRDGSLIGTIPAGIESYNDTGLNPLTSYEYKITSVDTSGNESTGTTQTITTPAAPDTTPTAPVSTVTETHTSNSATINWVNPLDGDLKQIIVKRDGSTVYTGSGTSFTDTGLDPSTTYSYEVVAEDNAGNFSTAETISVTTSAAVVPDTTPPVDVADLQDSSVTGDSATLSWSESASSDIDHYDVYQDGVLIDTLPKGTTTTTVSGLSSETTYEFKVVGVDANNNESTGSTLTVTTSDVTAPDVPTGLNVTNENSQVTLNWTANSGSDTTEYYIYQDGVKIDTVSHPNNSYVATGLTNGNTYQFTISSVDAEGNESVQSSATTAAPEDTDAPLNVSGILETHTADEVSIVWSLPVDADRVSINVYRDGSLITSLGASDSTYTDSGLTDETTYVYKVTTVDSTGNESTGVTVTVTTDDITAPAVPGIVAAVAGDGKVDLSWPANTDSDFSHYVLRQNGSIIEANLTGTTFSVTGLSNDTEYSFTLSSVDASGNESAVTSEVKSTPTAPVVVPPADTTAPAVPTGLSAVEGDTKVDLSWIANTESDFSHYVLRQNGLVIQNNLTSTTFSVMGLVNDAEYSFTLSAVDTNGNESTQTTVVKSTPIAPVTPPTPPPVDTTAPTVPSTPTAVVGDGKVDLSWSANTDSDFSHYVLRQNGSIIQSNLTGNTFSVTGLSNDTEYSFTLSAVDTSGNESVVTSEVKATPVAAVTPSTPPPVDTTAPAVPTSLTATPGNGKVDLSWTANTDSDFSHYVLRQNGSVIQSNLTGTTFSVTSLSNDTEYSFTLSAVDFSGNESDVSSVTKSTPVAPVTPPVIPPVDTIAPAIPSGLAATAGNGKVDLTWAANTDSDFSHYVLRKNGTIIQNSLTSTNFSVTGLSNGTEYSFTLTAVDTNGNESAVTDVTKSTPVAPSTGGGSGSTGNSGSGSTGTTTTPTTPTEPPTNTVTVNDPSKVIEVTDATKPTNVVVTPDVSSTNSNIKIETSTGTIAVDTTKLSNTENTTIVVNPVDVSTITAKQEPVIIASVIDESGKTVPAPITVDAADPFSDTQYYQQKEDGTWEYVKPVKNEDGTWTVPTETGIIGVAKESVNYSDIADSSSAEAIVKLSNIHVLKGFEDGTFKPDQEITRAEFATTLVRALIYKEQQESGSKFGDIDSSSWYYNAVVEGEALGIIKGISETEFAPDLIIPNEQAIAILTRWIQRNSGPLEDGVAMELNSTNGYGDISAWAQDEVEAGYYYGVATVAEGPLAAQGKTTRGQAAELILMLLEKY